MSGVDVNGGIIPGYSKKGAMVTDSNNSERKSVDVSSETWWATEPDARFQIWMWWCQLAGPPWSD